MRRRVGVAKKALREKRIPWDKHFSGHPWLIDDIVYQDPNYRFCIVFHMGGIESIAMASRQNMIWRYYKLVFLFLAKHHHYDLN